MFLSARSCFGVLLICSAPLLHAQQLSHAFVDVTVIPMDQEKLLEHQTVLVTGDRVTAIGPTRQIRVPAGAIAIDGRGKFLIPGLGDAHVHLSTQGGAPELAQRGLTLLALHGVTMARSMYTEPHHAAAVARVKAGEAIGPWVQLASPALTGQTAGTPAMAAALVRQHVAAGYSPIKILPGLSRESFDSAVAEARRLNQPLTGHVAPNIGLTLALKSGYISLEHLDGLLEALLPDSSASLAARGGFFGYGILDLIDEQRMVEVVAAIKTSGVTVVPTESGMEAYVSLDAVQLSARPEMRFVPPALVAQWKQQKEGFTRGMGITQARADRYRDVRRRLIHELQRADVPIALGSDGFSLFHVPGFSTLIELETYVASGLTPFQALRTATVHVARLMALKEPAGTVAIGAPADLVLLESNPLTDIAAVRRQAGVMIGGKWLPRAEIERHLSTLTYQE